MTECFDITEKTVLISELNTFTQNNVCISFNDIKGRENIQDIL